MMLKYASRSAVHQVQTTFATKNHSSIVTNILSRTVINRVRLAAPVNVRTFFWSKNKDDTKSPLYVKSNTNPSNSNSSNSDDGGNDGMNNNNNNNNDDDNNDNSKKRGSFIVKGDTEDTITNELIIPDRNNAIERQPIGENAPRPGQLLAIPIARRPIFPGFMAPLVITDESLIQAMTTIKSTSKPYIGLFLVKDPTVDLQVDRFTLKNIDQIHRMGVMAHIQQLEAGPAGAIAMVMAHRRIRATGTVTGRVPPLIVKVDHINQPLLDDNHSDEIKATCNEILATLREIIRMNPLFQQHIAYFARKIDVTNPYALADFAASLTTLDAKDLQDVIETVDLQPRLRKALLLLKKEQQLSQLQQTIKQDVEKRIDKQQRQYFLQEQLKSIKRELGVEKDDKETLINKFNDRVAKLVMPATAKTVYDEEIEKLQMLERNSSEFNVTRSYLDWLTSLPWGKYSQDNFDIAGARKILDEDHYGMNDVKDRILEFIAVGKLKGTVQGKILCLVGPPGVGKTSIGKSIARSLNRSFYRFSVGGLSDVAEIKGHRRTYIGAMPGKLIQCLKSTGVSNPLVLIDEIDKIGVGRGYSGDPSSALLEMLDPNQNGTFMDHYLDTPVDASKVLFICTANSLDTIPGPLLDRMEIIRLSGYDAPEKVQIVKRYLEPKTRTEMGLENNKVTTPKTLQLQDDAIEHLIRWYARESGVRNLEKLISKVFRKAAMKIVAEREKILAEKKKTLEALASTQIATDAAVPVTPSEVITETNTSSISSPSPSTTVGSNEISTVSSSVSATNNNTDGTNPTATNPSDPSSSSENMNASSTVSSNTVPVDPPSSSSTPPPSPPAEEIPVVEDSAWTITAENLEEYVGKPIFTSDRLYDVPPAGVTMGLAWTNMGGSALYIEVASPYLRSRLNNGGGANTAVSDKSKTNTVSTDKDKSDDSSSNSKFPSGGNLRITGKMGDVMQESAQIAYTLARRYLRSIPNQQDNDYLDTVPLHMHVPEGATPKDGPSAGITMTTALLSSAMEKPVRPDLAMTGEIDLLGSVLPVGGIKEKTMAARRAGVKCLIFPKNNKRDFDELPNHLKENLEVYFAATYDDVYKVAFDYKQEIIVHEAARTMDPKQHPVHTM